MTSTLTQVLRTSARTVAVSLVVALAVAAAPAAAAPERPAERPAAITRFDDSVVIQSVRQARRVLKGTPRGFRAFVGRSGARVSDSLEPSCQDLPGGIGVKRHHARGFGVGRVQIGSCGGGGAMWKERADGKWRRIAITSDGWACSMLDQHRVPASLIAVGGKASCFDETTGTTRRYQRR